MTRESQEMSGFREEVRRIYALADRFFEVNKQLDAFRVEYRIVEKDGGFELQETVPYADGSIQWKRAAWTNNRKAIERSLALRQKSK